MVTGPPCQILKMSRLGTPSARPPRPLLQFRRAREVAIPNESWREGQITSCFPPLPCANLDVLCRDETKLYRRAHLGPRRSNGMPPRLPSPTFYGQIELGFYGALMLNSGHAEAKQA